MQRQTFFSSESASTTTTNLSFARQVALEKGRLRLKSAKKLDLLLLPQHWSQVVNILLEAIELGSQEAGSYLAKRILKNCEIGINKNWDLTPVLAKLEKIHATNSVAAYTLGEIYSGFLHPTVKQFLPVLPEEKSSSTRQEKAIEYLNIAIIQGDDSARVSLSIAFSRGKGCIVANEKKWVELNKNLADEGSQACAYDYASFLSLPSDTLVGNKETYLKYLLMATRGKNLTIAYEALEKICSHFKNEVETLKEKGGSLLELLQKEVSLGNQFITYSLAYCYCPKEILLKLDSILHPPALLPELFSKIEPSLEKTEDYLSLATSGSSMPVCAAANLFQEKLKASRSSVATPQ